MTELDYQPPSAASLSGFGVSVRTAGAAGNGVADDTAAFQLAAFVAGTGTVLVPPGTYLLTSPVSYPATFLLLPGARIVNAGYITGPTDSLDPMGYDAIQGVGNFDAWLEGTHFSNPAANTFVATLFKVFYDGTTGTFDVDQAGGPLSVGAGNGIKWNQTVAGVGDTQRYLEIAVEDASIFNGDTCTISFIAQAETGSFPVTLDVRQNFGSGGSPSAGVLVASQAVTVDTTSRRFTVTFDVPSTAGKTFGSNFDDAFRVKLRVPLNAVFSLSVRQLKIERGIVRTAFNQTPRDVEYAFISRFFQSALVSLGAVATAGAQFCYAPIPFKGEMRRAPTITWGTVAGAAVNNITTATPTATHVQTYGATAFISSTAAGAFNASGQVAKLDARIA